MCLGDLPHNVCCMGNCLYRCSFHCGVTAWTQSALLNWGCLAWSSEFIPKTSGFISLHHWWGLRILSLDFSLRHPLSPDMSEVWGLLLKLVIFLVSSQGKESNSLMILELQNLPWFGLFILVDLIIHKYFSLSWLYYLWWDGLSSSWMRKISLSFCLPMTSLHELPGFQVGCLIKELWRTKGSLFQSNQTFSVSKEACFWLQGEKSIFKFKANVS